VAGSPPLALHPQNPHYLWWRGQPTVLITSGEHYGAVLNRAFDYKRYLATLEADGMNLTRTFSGAYCEPVGAFKIQRNTLASPPGDLLARGPAATRRPCQLGNKFDLTSGIWRTSNDSPILSWRRVSRVVVEMVLFCPFPYEDSMW
jgi:hypothetical protein